jgi:transcriptional regulator with XRE-family HTH domain
MQVKSLVAQRREAKGIKQYQLAMRIGIRASFLSEIESGFKNPSLPIALQLATALDCDVRDLFYLPKD